MSVTCPMFLGRHRTTLVAAVDTRRTRWATTGKHRGENDMRNTKPNRAGHTTRKVIGPLFAIAAAAGVVAACGDHDELDTAAARTAGLPADYAAPDVHPGRTPVVVGLPADYAAPDVHPGRRPAIARLPADYAAPDVLPGRSPVVAGLPADYAAPDVHPGRRAAAVSAGLPVDYAAPDVHPGHHPAIAGLPADYPAPDARPGLASAPEPVRRRFVFRS
jgi:hypothetical protein